MFCANKQTKDRVMKLIPTLKIFTYDTWADTPKKWNDESDVKGNPNHKTYHIEWFHFWWSFNRKLKTE